MMNWQTFGVVAALAWGLVLLASFVWQISPLRLGFSARDKNTWAALLLFAAIATVEAQKPEQLRVENGEWRVERKRGNLVQTTVSDADIARSYALVEENDNAAAIEVPTNAVTVGNWHRHGARSSIGNHRLDLAPWSFPMGTNDASFSSFWYFVEGKLRPTPRDRAHEICAVGAPMLAMQGASCLFLSVGDDDSRTLIWDNFFLNCDTNAPVTAMVRLWPNGDFATQSNSLRRAYARINPADWDGDGLANEIDPAPTSCDGDCYGTANALPTNANPDAYYWLDMSATGALGVATIRVTCDGPSDLGDHVVIARTNEVCHVPLIAGATYAVESDLPIGASAVSSEYAEIVTNDAYHLTVSLPLEAEFTPDGNGGYAFSTSPVNVGAVLTNAVGGCCSPTLETNGLTAELCGRATLGYLGGKQIAHVIMSDCRIHRCGFRCPCRAS